jgi:hypothetical protein
MNSTDICNIALGYLGQPHIMSMEDGTPTANLCKLFYQPSVDKLLREHTWSFATDFKELSPLSETSPDADYGYVYQIPTDCMRVQGIDIKEESFRIIGRKILVNYEPLILTYSRRITDATQFDPLFIDALQYFLATELVSSMTQDAKMSQYLSEKFAMRLMVAKSINAQENVRALQPEVIHSAFLESRIN